MVLCVFLFYYEYKVRTVKQPLVSNQPKIDKDEYEQRKKMDTQAAV